MKKLLSRMLSLAVMLSMVACQEDFIEISDGNPVAVSFCADIPQTRAFADYGGGSKINRCIMQVYQDNEKYNKPVIQEMAGGHVEFSNILLVPGYSYDFVFWADCSKDGLADNHYNTTDLTEITVNGGYTGNNDEFDAFTCVKRIKVDAGFTESVVLTRPFGQVSVRTDDIGKLPESEKPTSVEMTLGGVCPVYNALTEAVSGEQTVTYRVDVEDAATGEISVDYLFASTAQDLLVKMDMRFYNGQTLLTPTLSRDDIPVRRNVRTKISGNFLTVGGN